MIVSIKTLVLAVFHFEAMKTYPTSKKSEPRNKGGFALVITLFLIALLAILVVGLLTRTTRENRLEGLVNHQAAAKTNALFALEEAMGRLQSVAGPDTRVTAPASILDEDPSTPEMENVANPYWVGVWKTTQDGLDEHPLIERPYLVSKTPEPLFPGVESHLVDARTQTKIWKEGQPSRAWDRELDVMEWLVSSPDRSDSGEPLSPDPRDALTAGDSITMVGAREGMEPLLAPRAPLSNEDAYAYWVGDQSLKAKVTVYDPYEDESINPNDPKGKAMRPLLSSLDIPIETLEGLESLDNGTPEDRKKARFLSDLSLLAGGTDSKAIDEILPQYVHKLTTQSYGVPADVTRGGLKQNLTAFLESPSGVVSPKSADYPGMDDDTPMIDAARFRYYSPKFGLLRDYGNELIPQSGSGAIMEVRPPQLSEKALHPGDTRQTAPVTGPRTTAGVHPVITECSIYLVPAYDPEDGLVKMLLFPRVQLYNPYSVKMKGETYAVQLSVKWFKKFYHEVTAERNGAEIKKIFNFDTNWGFQGGRPFHGSADFTFQLDPIDIEAGETLLFCPDPEKGAELIGGDRASRFYWSNQGNASLMRLSPHIDPAELTCFWVATSNEKYFESSDELKTVRVYVPSPWYPANNYWGPHRLAKLFWSKNGDIPKTNWTSFRKDSNMPLLQVVESYANIRGNRGIWPNFNRTYQFNTVEEVLDGAIPRDLHKYWWLGYRMLRYPETSDTLNAWHRGDDHEFPVVTQYDFRAPYAWYQPPTAGGRRYVRGPAGRSNAHDFFAAPWTGSTGVEGLAIDGLAAPLYDPDRSVFKTSPFFWPGTSQSDLIHPLFEPGLENVPQISLGQFRHASLSAFNHFPSNILGESFASIYAPRGFSAPNYTSYRASWNSVRTRQYSYLSEFRRPNEVDDPPDSSENWNTDYFLAQDVNYSGYDASYEVNHNLWDRFLLTGIDPNTEERSGEKWTEGEPLPNPRLVLDPFRRDAGKINHLRDFHLAARELMIDGAFNVNCTDADVWALALKSLRNHIVLTKDGPDALSEEVSAFARYLIPPAKHADPEISEDLANWTGFRELTDDQIDGLAEKIVEQVKIRAPFVSLADFVNRRLILENAYAPVSGEETVESRTGLSGALQAAIDDDELQLNAHLADYNNATEANPANAQGSYKSHNPPHRFAGAPGALTQGDLLTRISSNLTPRGDTFIIRAYGEKNASRTGTKLATAWCEAVVQRTNRYMDSSEKINDIESDPPERRTADLVSELNRKFGRRFEVVSFRWLNEMSYDK